jgi:hypothetical protein
MYHHVKKLMYTVRVDEPRATHRRTRRAYKTGVRMPFKLDPHIATIQAWLAAQPQLTALAIVGRLSEKHPEEFGTRQHSIVQRLLRALRLKAAEQLVAQRPLGDATTASQLPGVADGSGYVGPDPPTAPLVKQTGKATWRGRSIDIGSSTAIAPSGNIRRCGNTGGHYCRPNDKLRYGTGRGSARQLRSRQ